MNRMKFVSLLFCLFFIGNTYIIYAQAPLLPDMIGATNNGVNIITWTSQYNGIKSIAVQRSKDSVNNFATIGYVKNLAKGEQAYIDGHPMVGNNYYQLSIVFSSDLTWTSNVLLLKVDSMQLINKAVLPPNDSLQKYAEKVVVKDVIIKGNEGTFSNNNNAKPTPAITIPSFKNEISDYTYVKSQFVFTNPFTGHINIEIADVTKDNYHVEFLNKDNNKIFETPRIMYPKLVVDKRNFQNKGLYKFILYKNKVNIETGYITIY